MSLLIGNKKAIVVYLDNYDKIDSEFSWLYKTWLLHALDKEFDLVVYHEPEARHRLPKYPGIVRIPMPCIRMGKEYPFLKSSYMFEPEWNSHLLKYDYIFKTDCDVFLTKNLKSYTPSKLLIGEGGYYHNTDEEKVKYIELLVKNHFNSRGKYKFFTNVGASFFGKTNIVITICQEINRISEQILQKELFKPHFDKGITSMIAGEIAVNTILNQQHFVLYMLDSACWEYTEIGNNILHIHAWHTIQKWSKHAFFKDEYTDWKIPSYQEALKNAANYCHWIATTPLEEIVKYRK